MLVDFRIKLFDVILGISCRGEATNSVTLCRGGHVNISIKMKILIYGTEDIKIMFSLLLTH